jgi:hypothetical protein
MQRKGIKACRLQQLRQGGRTMPPDWERRSRRPTSRDRIRRLGGRGDAGDAGENTHI